jgi:hypothetical protein
VRLDDDRYSEALDRCQRRGPLLLQVRRGG